MKVGDLVCVKTLPSYMGIVIAKIRHDPLRAVALDGESYFRMRVRFAETDEVVEWPERDLRMVNESR